jgi:hypothetical protein
MIAATLLSTMLFVAITSIQSTRSASTTVARGMDASRTLRSTMRRLTEELRSSSRAGEDTNGNAALDPGEDTNSNGRLDSDWAVTPTSITFNRYLPDNRFSGPVTYRFDGSILERVFLSSNGNYIAAEITSLVTAFSITDTDGRVSISMTVTKTDPNGNSIEQEITAYINPRN